LTAVGAVIALRPEIVRGTFSSATSVLRVALLVLAWVAFSWTVRRFVQPLSLRVVVLGVAGAALLWFTVVPYFQDETVEDELPAVAAPTATTAPAAPAEAPSPTVPSGPVKLSAGELEGLAGHRGSGEAALYRQPDGSLLVRFEGFNVSSVPAPVVYLVPGAGRESPGGVKLGGLRGNRGDLNIPVPAGTDVSGPQTILIWCEAFSVPVAGATATPA
jgi:hypothetical protein